MKYLIPFFLVLIIACSTTVKQDSLVEQDSMIVSFETFQHQTENPIELQQAKAIQKNKIKKCTITKWEQSPNEDTLEFKVDHKIIYYNEIGRIDSSVHETYETKRVHYEYDEKGRLTKRVEHTNKRWAMNIEGLKDENDSSVSTFRFKGGEVLEEERVRQKGQDHLFKINYQIESGKVQSVKLENKEQELLIDYKLIYEDDKLIKRIISSNSEDRMKPDRTNEFIYSDGNLIEITNTWLFALELLENESNSKYKELPSAELSDISSTKFSYDENGRLNTHQKVYGMWPGESLWITSYSYLDNGLINEKEMNNDGEFGHTKIIYKYNYE